MVRFLKKLIWLTGLGLCCQSAFGFALLGPIPTGADSYQVGTIGYQLGTVVFTGVLSTAAEYPLADIGTPKNIAEGYRRNTPILYYAFDSSFLNFFGTNGAAEVDKAMAYYNNLANVSAYSPDLSEFPTDSRRENFRAVSSSLLDLKSVTMGLITEQLGFWAPARWVWAIHTRAPGTACPLTAEYEIDRRNFDFVPSAPNSYQESSYVNGVLYSYFINERCTGPNPLADAIEFPVDPLSHDYSAVADYASFWYQGLPVGTFYTGLTRDDVGGLRYLIRSNNLAIEPSGARTIEFVTNSLSQAAFVTNQDLHLLSVDAFTNDPVTLAGLFPGLVITSTVTNFTTTKATNITETLTNSPLDPVGTAPSHPLFTTNVSTNFTVTYQETFGNVVTNTFSPKAIVGTISLGLIPPPPLSPAGTAATVVTNAVKFTITPGVFGSFFLLPTGLCSASILSNALTTLIYTTNLPVGGILPTNAVGGGAATNTVVAFVPGSVNVFTQQTLIYLPVTCPTNTVADRQGVEKIVFIRRDYDSLLNQFWQPVTNDYTLTQLTNSTFVSEHMQRPVPKPDFVFSAADLALNTSITYSNSVGNAFESFSLAVAGLAPIEVIRTMNFDQTTHPPQNAGPGTIVTPFVLPTVLVYNKNGPLFLNAFAFVTNSSFLGEAQQTPFFDISWGSFDGTTNEPVVYPNGSSLTNLENALTGPFITTAALPAANVGVNYTTPLAATGGVPPYTWSLTPGSTGLPTGLSVTTDPQSGIWEITGVPSGQGNGTIYDFSIRVTDSSGAFKDVPFTITLF